VLAGWADATWDMGREFGTIGARAATTVEITTYRTDAYDGETRKPVVVFGDSLVDDLERRDFTVNAMAVRLPDLSSSTRSTARRPGRAAAHAGHPGGSFGDDPLRMMRAARFASQLGMTPDARGRSRR
jgi:poly(A) polymerase